MTTPGPQASSAARALEGLIRGLSTERISTADLWSAIREAGIPADFAAVNQMRSAAVSLRNAGEALVSALPSDALTSDMIGRSYYRGVPSSSASVAQYQINVPYSYTDTAGNSINSFVSTSVTSLPSTVGELFDLAGQTVDQSESVPPGAVISSGVNIQRFF